MLVQVSDAGPQDVMDLLLLTQYFDMLKDISYKNKSSSSLFLPHGPHAVSELRAQLKDSFVVGKKRG